MISLTRFHTHERIAINPDLIERIEETPDTVITLTNGAKYLVEESIDQIVDIMEVHRARVLAIARRMAADERAVPSTGRLRLLRGYVVDDVDTEGDGAPEVERP